MLDHVKQYPDGEIARKVLVDMKRKGKNEEEEEDTRTGRGAENEMAEIVKRYRSQDVVGSVQEEGENKKREDGRRCGTANHSRATANAHDSEEVDIIDAQIDHSSEYLYSRLRFPVGQDQDWIMYKEGYVYTKTTEEERMIYNKVNKVLEDVMYKLEKDCRQRGRFAS